MLPVKSISGLLAERVLNSAEEPAYWQLNQLNNWVSTSWKDFQQQVQYVANDLKERGLQKGQVIGIMGTSNLQWEIAHLAILTAGGVAVGLDPNEPPEQLKRMVKMADIAGIFIDNPQQLEMLQEFDLVITLSEYSESDDLPSISAIICCQQKNNYSAFVTDVQADDVATIIFTSGTTGTPKGISYSHRQVLLACENILGVYSNINCASHLVSWLPLSNLFQRILNLCALSAGAQIFFVENPREIVEHLPQINPHIFVAVPRFYEKLYGELENQLNKQPFWLRNFIYFSLTQAESTNIKGRLFKKLNSLLLKKFRALFGNNIQYMISGSAPISVRLLKRFAAMDLLILETYGLSENILPLAANSPDNYQFGSVGKAMAGNELKLAEDNELLVNGPCVFDGYLGREKRSVTDNGFHPSGDFAEIDERGFIYLTGRKSEILKTSTGRKIAPAAIEAELIQIQGIDQAIVIGANQKFLTAIITLNNGEQAPTILKQLTNNLHSLPLYKRPAGLIVTTEGFSLAKNEITSNLKLKRNTIQENFSEHIEQLYTQLKDPDSDLQKQTIIVNSTISLYKIEQAA